MRLFLLTLLFSFAFSGYCFAEVGPKNGDTWVPVLPKHASSDTPNETTLTVEDVPVDKTAENSVVARDQAIADAPRIAFQKLAERNLGADAAKNIKVPKDISSLVADYEIKDEHMSSTRYVAKFTVRFSDAVRQYIAVKPPVVAGPPLPGPQPVPGAVTATGLPPLEAANAPPPGTEAGGVAWNAESGRSFAPPAAEPVPAGATVLVLPYFENMAGQTLLWEDPNPWRRIWQNAMPKTAAHFVVPLGDIGDIAAGPSNAVWSGNYTAVEKLRQNYHAEEVVLLAANKSGSIMTVDIYSYRDGKLRHRGSITPYAGDKTEEEAYRDAMMSALHVLQQGSPLPPGQRPAPSVEAISRETLRGAGLGTAGAPVLKPSTPPYPYAPVPASVAPQPYTPAYVPSPGVQQQYSTAVQQQYPTAVQQHYTQQSSYAAPQPYPGAVQQQYPGAAQQPYPNAAPQPAPGMGGRTQIDAMVSFPSFQTWMEMQRRLNAMAPSVGVDIRSLTSDGAEVTLNYDGSLDMLKGVLAGRGLALGRPGLNPPPGVFYSLQLVH